MRPRPTFDATRPIVERLLGGGVTHHVPVEEGGYSPTGRWLVTLDDGRSAFVKAELEWSDDHGLSTEQQVYSAVAARCLPELLGYDGGGDGAPRVLVTEDLSAARWGTPLDARDVESLVDALEELDSVVAPAGIPASDLDGGWARFTADVDVLVATGLADEAWVTRHLTTLDQAARGAHEGGDRLLHTDLWLQNWCRAERGVVLVDWAGARAGNPLLMRAYGEAAVRAAGGPPGLVLRDDPAWASWMAGLTAAYLTQSHDGWPPRLMETERREALACLHWACAELDLPVPALSPGFAALGPWRP